jgi:hypothetical protein
LVFDGDKNCNQIADLAKNNSKKKYQNFREFKIKIKKDSLKIFAKIGIN